jgi:hypothetical protein
MNRPWRILREFDLPDYAKPWVAEYRAWEQRVGRKNVWEEIRKH